MPVDQIVAGLCYALARNYVANLVRGREVVKPVVFQGGVALNQGVLRAFKDILGLADSEMLRPEMPHMAGAIGAAQLAMQGDMGLEIGTVEQVAASAREVNGYLPVETGDWRMEDEAGRGMRNLENREVMATASSGEQVFIGLDIGSISTKGVALKEDGSLVAKVYLFTAGRPLAAVQRVLTGLAESLEEADVVAVGVTGSGRKLAGHAVGADLVIDEITAQAKGAGYGIGQADTVIEIGGQDAKFIRLGEDFTVADFEMNRVCAAGTGSFIQEQAARLGIDLKNDYASLALSSANPLPFASRCTVFMGSDLVHYIQQGVGLPDLLMGVSRAVVENYIDRVAQGRTLGRRVVFQGGVAKNRSVVEAFRTRLPDATVTVHPHPGESGAIGVALLARERHRQHADAGSSFKGFDIATTYDTDTFICSGCENRCEVSVFRFKEDRFLFGDLCGRYSEAIGDTEPGHDLTPDMAGLLEEEAAAGDPSTMLGIPRTMLFREFYPFWKTFFAELAIPTRVSGPSGSEVMALALSRLPAETCLPVKLLFGHVAALEKEGVRTVFIPSRNRLAGGLNCPYVQHGGAMVQANFEALRIITLPLVPDLPDKEKERLLGDAARALGRPLDQVRAAYLKASQAMELFRQHCRYEAGGSGPRPRPLAVLLGKPYNLGDRFVNMALAAKLAKAGFDVVEGDQLAVPGDLRLPEHYNSITWVFSRRMLKIALQLTAMDDIYPVVVGNFGCGPDAYTFPLLNEIFADRPALFLEFDEHRADAGLATRVEAFAHRVAAWRTRQQKAKKRGQRDAGPRTRPETTPDEVAEDNNTEYIIPYFSDHAYAFLGAFKAMGVKARVLPLPDHRSYETGVELSGGKQCHPFQLLAGDLVNLARAGDLPRGARYFIPIVETSCLITQYVPTMQQYMDRMGRSDVRVISPNSTELLHRLGPMTWFNLGKALLGIEYLGRLRFERRPYEMEKGSVDRVYAAGLTTICQGHLTEKINQAILEAARTLDAVPTRGRGSKPVIAITGDVYTRVNPVANGGLFDLLEELGCEVWPSPTLVDLVMTGQEIRTRQYWEAGRPLDTLSAWGRVLVNNLGANIVMKNFAGRINNLSEPHADEVLKFTEGLLPGEPELLILLNVAKHVDFAHKGVDGILNVYCLNCLVGTATTSIFKGLAGRTGGVPMMSLVIDAGGMTHIKNRVEAFVHRVKRNREEKLAAAAAMSGGERHSPAGHVASLKELFEQKISEVRLPEIKLPQIRIPDLRLAGRKLPLLKVPQMRLPQGLRGGSKKKERGESKSKR